MKSLSLRNVEWLPQGYTATTSCNSNASPFAYRVHSFNHHTNCHPDLYFDRDQVAAFLPYTRIWFGYSCFQKSMELVIYLYLHVLICDPCH